MAQQAGEDILFDCESRTVLKFVLHTNVPGHFDFGIYSRCNFTVHVDRNDIASPITIEADSKLEQFRSLFTNNACVNNEDDDEDAPENRTYNNSANYNRPVVLNKSSSASDGENPFGSTFCYGTDQVIVEVMDNSHIASVILYQTTMP
ncbi:UPF0183 protein T01G9.2 [Ditylenchus destructor]|nr:UPF0183 protein T01G9.2 [Ditylenchus destructor]